MPVQSSLSKPQPAKSLRADNMKISILRKLIHSTISHLSRFAELKQSTQIAQGILDKKEINLCELAGGHFSIGIGSSNIKIFAMWLPHDLPETRNY